MSDSVTRVGDRATAPEISLLSPCRISPHLSTPRYRTGGRVFETANAATVGARPVTRVKSDLESLQRAFSLLQSPSQPPQIAFAALHRPLKLLHRPFQSVQLASAALQRPFQELQKAPQRCRALPHELYRSRSNLHVNPSELHDDRNSLSRRLSAGVTIQVGTIRAKNGCIAIDVSCMTPDQSGMRQIIAAIGAQQTGVTPTASGATE